MKRLFSFFLFFSVSASCTSVFSFAETSTFFMDKASKDLIYEQIPKDTKRRYKRKI